MKDVKPVNNRYTEEELMVRLKFFIGICLALTLIGIVFTVLYSIMFVTQPLNAISPIDSKFFELIIPVATFLCGTLSGIMLAGTGKDAAMTGMNIANAANKAANGNGTPTPVAPTPAGPIEPVFSATTKIGGTTLSMNVPGRPAPPAPPPPPTPPKPNIPAGPRPPVNVVEEEPVEPPKV